MTPALLTNLVIRVRKALKAAEEKAADALARFKTARDNARQIKRQYKNSRKMAKQAKKLAIQAEDSVQEQQRLLAKAEKKLLKAREAAKNPQVATVRKRVRTTAGSS